MPRGSAHSGRKAQPAGGSGYSAARLSITWHCCGLCGKDPRSTVCLVVLCRHEILRRNGTFDYVEEQDNKIKHLQCATVTSSISLLVQTNARARTLVRCSDRCDDTFDSIRFDSMARRTADRACGQGKRCRLSGRLGRGGKARRRARAVEERKQGVAGTKGLCFGLGACRREQLSYPQRQQRIYISNQLHYTVQLYSR